MNQKTIIALITLIVIGLVGGGYWYVTHNPARLTELQLKLGLISQEAARGLYSVSGYIEADEVAVEADTKGRILRLRAEEGQYVQAGQRLIELDTALLAAEMDQARAKIETAEARLARVEAGVPAEEVAKAEAAVAVAEAQAQAAHTQWQDAITLRDNPQELNMQIDAARTALDLAELQIAAAIPRKDADEALWELRRQQWEYTQEEHRKCRTNPMTGKKMCMTFEFPEGAQQDIGVAWNYAGADMWASWVDLNGAVADQAEAETRLADLQRLRDDPQEAQIKVAQAQAAYQTAQAEVAVAQKRLARLEAGPRPEQVALAQTQVEQAQANLAALQVQREKSILTAPRAGWVVERVAHEGEMAVPGAALLTLADLTQVTLTVYVPEPDVDLVSVGQRVEVFVDTFPGEPFGGTITFIADEAEFTPKNVQTKEERVNTVFAVKIDLENEAQRLRPGMPADAILADGSDL
jgi:multidrug resistance efflux pump